MSQHPKLEPATDTALAVTDIVAIINMHRDTIAFDTRSEGRYANANDCTLRKRGVLVFRQS